jgi:hypothetical protein
MKLDLDEAYEAFEEDDYNDEHGSTKSRDLLMEQLVKFFENYGGQYAGLADIIQFLDNGGPIGETYNKLEQFCRDNELECEALDIDSCDWENEENCED